MFQGFSFSMNQQAQQPQKKKHNIQGKKDDKQRQVTVVSHETLTEQNEDKPKVIPAQPNTFGNSSNQQDVKYKLTDLNKDKELKFESEGTNMDQKSQQNYGLEEKNKRQEQAYENQEERETKRLKYDLQVYPDVDESEAYDEMPIEDFGLAVMRGMGWTEGKPIGLRCKEVVDPKVPDRRPDRLGLGATFKALPKPEKAGQSQDKQTQQQQQKHQQSNHNINRSGDSKG